MPETQHMTKQFAYSKQELSVKAAAQRLGVSPQQIHRLINSRKLTAQKNQQGSYEISLEDLEELASKNDFPSCPLMCPLLQ
ncbi:helix-turn-helix domain-containing protein [Phormidium tenue FACHB-886]|nr:helix-turn-helix domain-containing protein [Phormidium tenue FACHB-886]